MPFIAYNGARPSAGLEHVCSRLFNETISQWVSHPPAGWPHDHGPTNVGAMVKRINKWHLNPTLFDTSRVLSLLKKFFHHIFWGGNFFFLLCLRFYAQFLKRVFRGLLSNQNIQWMSLTNKPGNQLRFYVFGKFSVVLKCQKSISGSD